MDIGRRDFFIAAEPGFINEAVDPTWAETWRASVGYNNMPLIESIDEFQRFGKVERLEGYNPVESMTDDDLPFYEDLVRAKNPEHFDYIRQRVDRANQRRDILARGHWSAALAGGITDPLFLTTFVPGLNAIGLGRTVLSATGRASALGFGFGIASEARRAPFAVADEEYEAAMNIASSTAISGFFGGAFKGAGYMMPFVESSAKKVGRLARGEKIKHIWGDGAANLDDGVAVKRGSEYDPVVDATIVSGPIHKQMSMDHVPQDVKKMMLDLVGNSSIPVQGNRAGIATQSVAQVSATFEGLYYNLEANLRDFHKQHIGAGEKARSVMGIYSPFTQELDGFIEDTMKRRILMDHPDPAIARSAMDGISDAQREAIKMIDTVIEGLGEDLTYTGVLKTNEQITKNLARDAERIEAKAKLMADIEAKKRADGTYSQKQFAKIKQLEDEIEAIRGRMSRNEAALNSPPRRNFKFGIYYNKELLLNDAAAREELTGIFERHYTRQRLEAKETIADAGTSAREDAERTVNRILTDDADDFEGLTPSEPKDYVGGAKHLRHRKTNIPEYEIADFMLLGRDALHAYISRVGKQIAFAQKFKGRNIDEVLEDLTDSMRKNGNSDKQISDARKAFSGDYLRVMGAYRRDPDRLDNQIAQVMKGVSGWTYLPLAGISAMTDVGSIALAHGFKDTVSAGFKVLDDIGFVGKVVKDLQASGEGLDISYSIMGRELVSDTVRRINSSRAEKFVNFGNKVYYTANFLGPITQAGKILNAIAVNNSFIKLSRQLVSGKISKRDEEFLRRFGISDELAEYMQKMPIEKSSTSSMEFANTTAWDRSTPQAREFVRQYQAAVSAHTNNTIIMGQTFDKPMIVDGMMYMKDNAYFQMMRKAFPSLYKIDKRASYGTEQLIRLDSGMLSLPFTFMNFAFGANNKIVNAMRDPNRKYRVQGAIALIGLSYMSLAIKKPDYWFEKRESPEVIARVIDHSGLLGVYSDIGYMGLQMAANVGMFPEEGIGPFVPKYVSPDKEDRLFDALTEPFGAPAGLALSYSRAINDFLNGRYNEGSAELFYNSPFLGLPYIKGDAKEVLLGGRN